MLDKIKNWLKIVRTLHNPIEYFLIVKGLKKSGVLSFRTKPDKLIFNMNTVELHSAEGTLNIYYLFEAINNSLYDVKYNCQKNEITLQKDAFSNTINFNWKTFFGLWLSVQKNLKLIDNLNNNSKHLEAELKKDEVTITLRKDKYLFSDVAAICEIWKDEAYKKYLPKSNQEGIIIDIGGYIGESALWFASSTNSYVHVYEPHPQLFSLLKRNVDSNVKVNGKIKYFNVGLGKTEETISLIEGEEGAWVGFGLNNTTTYGSNQKEVNIQVNSLKKIIDNCLDKEILLIKIDCEGAEFEGILNCDLQTLSKPNAYIIEYHGKPTTIENHLLNAGFKVNVIPPHHFVGETPIGFMYAEK